MQKMFLEVIVSAMCFWLLGCNGPNAPVIHQTTTEQNSPPAQNAAGLSFDNGASQIFAHRCSKCHAAGGVLPNWGDYATVFAKKDRVYQRVVVDKTMPPAGMGTITDEERATIGQWIQSGAQKSSQNPSSTQASPPNDAGTEPAPPSQPAPVSTTDYSSIKNVLFQCTACHSKNSNASLPIFPVLAGQQANYLENELLAFRSKMRHDKNAVDFMLGPASQLDDKSIHLLADYFSVQEATTSRPKSNEDFEVGKNLFEKGFAASGLPSCVGCHGQNAEGSVMAPRLAGQHKAYLINQFEAFKDGTREEAKMMPNLIKNMTAEQQNAIASYLESLHK